MKSSRSGQSDLGFLSNYLVPFVTTRGFLNTETPPCLPDGIGGLIVERGLGFSESALALAALASVAALPSFLALAALGSAAALPVFLALAALALAVVPGVSLALAGLALAAALGVSLTLSLSLPL